MAQRHLTGSGIKYQVYNQTNFFQKITNEKEYGEPAGK